MPSWNGYVSISSPVFRIRVQKRANNRNPLHLSLLLLFQDRVVEFWEVTRARALAAESMVKKLSLQLEEQQWQHSIDIKVYRDRMRSLMDQHAAQLAALHTSSAATLQRRLLDAEEASLAAKEAHYKEIQNLKAVQQCTEASMATLRVECEQRVAQERSSLMSQMTSIHDKYSTQSNIQCSEIEERCNQAILMATVQRDAALSAVVSSHEQAITELTQKHAQLLQSALDTAACSSKKVHVTPHRKNADDKDNDVAIDSPSQMNE